MTTKAFLCATQDVMPYIVRYHYLHRKVGASFAFVLLRELEVIGAVTFGTPASRAVQKSACPSNPDIVLELNRLWIKDGEPKNTASEFVSDALRQLPPRIIVSYADTSVGHLGCVYRAMNFNYAGWTDQDRKTPRCDYVVEGKHGRDAFRHNNTYVKTRRKPKVKYWIATGSQRQKRWLNKICGWPNLHWDGGPDIAAIEGEK